MPAAAFYSNRMTSVVEEVLLLQSEPQAALDGLTDDVQRESTARGSPIHESTTAFGRRSRRPVAVFVTR